MWVILVEGEEKCAYAKIDSRVWVILYEGEGKGAYANIVTDGCGGYSWRVKKKVRTPT